MSLHACSRRLEHAPFADDALERSIPERFALQVDRHSECVAVRDRGRSITYAELDAWSNGVAHELIAAGEDGPEPVPLVQHQGVASIAATLGVLKAGKFYVPLDPLEPAARLRRVVDEIGARLLVTDEESRGSTAEIRLPVLLVDGLACAQPPKADVPASAVAYVYFTSGSTGRPKGVYDSHRNVLHNVLRYTNALRIAPADRLTLLQRPSFSGAVSSLFGALLNGATSYPFRLDGGGIGDAGRWLADEEITIYHSVPSIFRTLAATRRAFPRVRAVRLEGDRATALDVALFQRHFAPDCVLANGLGTTETGLARQLIVRYGDEVADGILPVGYAVRDMETVILDEQGVELPPGIGGEIAVRSDYLALGYWNDPGLTEASFLPGPDGDIRRLYRTGDVGRLREDGCLEYLGRLDSELKVLGVRVDLAEVEAELVRLPGIADAAVTTGEGRRGEGRLLAYVVTENGSEVDGASLRRSLAERLPAHLIPSGFATLEALPVGANGKIDRDLLPNISLFPRTDPHEEDELVSTLAAIWSKVLEAPVGPDDDFFQLGGDSLAAAEIQSMIAQTTGVAPALAELVLAPTLREQADGIRMRMGDPRRNSIVELRAGESEIPLVLLHGTNGNALHYARLAPQITRRVLGMELDDPSGDLSVRALAERHLTTLRVLQPSGPYLLGGFCSGAVIAREMARLLAAEDECVPLLVVLGISPIDFPDLVDPAALRRWRSIRGKVTYHLRHARTLQPAARITYVGGRARTFARRAAARRRSMHSQETVTSELADAVARHRSGPYAGSILLVLDDETTRRYSVDPARDWKRLTHGNLSAHVLPGGDHAMLNEELIASTCAQLVSEALDQALAEPAQTLP